MARCLSSAYCQDCRRMHRCLHKVHDPAAQHYWDSSKKEGHTFTWVVGKTHQLTVLKSVFLWLSQDEITTTMDALEYYLLHWDQAGKRATEIKGILEKLRSQKRSPELLELAEKALKRMKRRKDTPLARKRWAHRLAKSAANLND